MDSLCVSLHDVAPRTLDACRRIADAVARVDAGLPLTLLVVPQYHGDTAVTPSFAGWIADRIAHGDELALHGWTHRDEADAPRTPGARARRCMYTAGEGEFSALSREDAAVRIERGRLWFAERGWRADGFVAPAWLASPGTWDALRDSEFLYTTTLSRLHLLRRGIALRAPSVVYSTRSAWRRSASRAWNAALARASASLPLVRVGFHPADIEYPHVMSQALSLVERLSQDRKALTKSAFVRTVR